MIAFLNVQYFELIRRFQTGDDRKKNRMRINQKIKLAKNEFMFDLIHLTNSRQNLNRKIGEMIAIFLYNSIAKILTTIRVLFFESILL